MSKSEDRKDISAGVGTMVGGGVAGLGARLGLGATAIHQGEKVGPLSGAELKAVRKSTRSRGVPIVNAGSGGFLGAMTGRGPKYIPPSTARANPDALPRFGVKGQKTVSRTYEVGAASVPGGRRGAAPFVAHELGHGGQRRVGSMRGRVMPKLYALGGIGSAIAGGVGGMVAGGSLAKHDEKRSKSMVRGAGIGAALGATLGAPTLIEEGRANFKAIRALGKAGLKGGRFWRSVGALGAAQGTYVLNATAPGAVAGAAGAAFGRAIKRDDERTKKMWSKKDKAPTS